MNGNDLGRAVGAQIISLLIAALIVGAVVALCGYFAISWLVANVSISLAS